MCLVEVLKMREIFSSKYKGYNLDKQPVNIDFDIYKYVIKMDLFCNESLLKYII